MQLALKSRASGDIYIIGETSYGVQRPCHLPCRSGKSLAHRSEHSASVKAWREGDKAWLAARAGEQAAEVAKLFAHIEARGDR